jgi:proliferating cell nuclear antigen
MGEKMKLVVPDAPTLKSVIDCIVSLVEEGQFDVRSDGIHLKAMDPSQISMVSFLMPKEAFVEYNLTEDVKLSLDISQFSNILSRGKRGEKAELSIEDGRLLVKFSGEKHNRMFKIPLIELGDKVQREPKIEFKNFAKVRADALKEALKDAKLVSSHVKFNLTPSSLIVDVKGDNGEVKAEFEVGSAEVLELKSEQMVKATFPLQYLEDIVKGTSSSSIITLYLETDRPLKLEYEMEGAKFVYYLAPRIETE